MRLLRVTTIVVRRMACAALLSILLAFGAAAQEQVLLQADFEDQVPGEPIGLGGAAFGQPISASPALSRLVLAGMDGQFLEMGWAEEVQSSSPVLIFEWLDQVEPDSGDLEILFELQMADWGRHAIGLREQGGAMRIFGEILIFPSGMIRAGDFDTIDSGFTYEPGETIRVTWQHDLTARTHTLIFNTDLVFENRAHGQTDRGLGRIFFQQMGNSPIDSALRIDNLRVRWFPDRIHGDRFESLP
jgi:hypothetical protein